MPSSSRATLRGPKTPRWSHTDDDPGPPLNENTIGRDVGSSTPSLVYAIEKNEAFFLPSSSVRMVRLAVAVYAMVSPPISTVCCVTAEISSW